MANSLDKFRKGVAQWSGNIGSAGISDAVVKTVPLASTSGLPTDTAVMITVNRVDANGKKTGNYEGIVGVVSGSNLIDCIRGVEGTAQAWTGGTVVEVLHTASNINELIDGILAEHNQDGTHDTTKVVDLTTAQTLTNKTLTSPLFQGSVDGWISANETWTYASASTITVPAGAAAKYAVGDRIKWTQKTVKYGVIVAVADTLLTIAVNTDYTVANEAISLNYYSHQASPVGYPQWFNYVPILSQGASTDIAKTVTFAKYNLVGRVVTTKVVLMATGTGTAGSNIMITLPITGERGRDFAIIGTGLYDDISSNTYCCVASYDNTNTHVMLIPTSITTRGSGVGSTPSLAVDSDDRFELVASYQM